MRKLLWTSLLMVAALGAVGCDDKGDDTGDTGTPSGGGTGGGTGGGGGVTGWSGGLSIDLAGASTACYGEWTFAGPTESGSWCTDCTYTFDTQFTYTTGTGSCPFDDFNWSVGYFPSYYGGWDAVVYEDGGTYWYWGVANMSGSSITWAQITLGYYYGYYPYYDYYYYGAGTTY